MFITPGMDFSLMSGLVIDDNDFVRFMIEKHLSNFGFQKVFEAQDGFEGLRVLNQEKPDIVICDINMRPVDGFEFLKQVRRLESPMRAVPVIFLTSHADESFVKKAIELQIDAYLLKPVMPVFLKKHIVKIMEKRLRA